MTNTAQNTVRTTFASASLRPASARPETSSPILAD
jgi:hypothetical protein